jgi:hypothetical protein
MANNYWIKLYHEVLDDPKMGRLSDSAYRRCIELFLMAGRDGNDDGSLPDFDDIAWKLRVSNDQLQSDLAELEAAGIVSFVDGNPFVTNFAKRQARISNADKQKAYRERKRLEELEENYTDDTESLPTSYGCVTDGNADIDKIRLDKIRLDDNRDAAEPTKTPQETLIELFEALTNRSASMEGKHNYRTYWYHPADALINYCGLDVELACLAVTEAVRIHNQPDNNYKLNTIKSIYKTAMNWIDESRNPKAHQPATNGHPAPAAQSTSQARAYGRQGVTS